MAIDTRMKIGVGVTGVGVGVAGMVAGGIVAARADGRAVAKAPFTPQAIGNLLDEPTGYRPEATYDRTVTVGDRAVDVDHEFAAITSNPDLSGVGRVVEHDADGMPKLTTFADQLLNEATHVSGMSARTGGLLALGGLLAISGGVALLAGNSPDN